jgi:hypothetical protein
VPRWHVAASGHIPCFLSCPEACMQGYPVYRVSTVAPASTLEEAVNPQVGPTSFSPRGFSETLS